MEKISIKLDGLGCASCAAKIEDRSKKLNGIEHAVLDFAHSKLTIEFNGKPEDVLQEITKVVHSLEPDVNVSLYNEHTRKKAISTYTHDYKELARFGIALSLFLLGIFIRKAMPSFGIAALAVAYIVSGAPVLKRSFNNILRGDVFDENFLMSIATIGAIAIGEYPEAVAVMIFYEIGEYFQNMAVNRSKSAISSLLAIRPDRTRVLKNGFWVDSTPEAVEIGDLIMVRPGERVPLDGTVVDGVSAVDVSALTGESIPLTLTQGDAIISGSLAQTGILHIKVTALFKDSTVSRILDLVENATAHKSETENFITKFARIYTPVVVGLALLIAILPPLFLGFSTFEHWLYTGLIFLVISCPCALVVSVPLSFFSGIGNASHKGILIKGSNYLEALTLVDHVVFDKTGTLTSGTFKVHAVHTAIGTAEDYVLANAALCESHSNHPIAKSIVAHYKQPLDQNALMSFEEVGGHGIVAQTQDGKWVVGNKKLMELNGISPLDVHSPYTLVYVALDGICIGAIDIRDQEKSDARETIEKLQKMGITCTMVTGDRKEVAEAVGHSLGIENLHYECLPEDKYNYVKQWLDNGERIAFVGDGINDAPVLAGATVGISMGAIGSDAAIEASDVVIMTDEPSKIVQALHIAKRTKRIVKQNITFALGMKVLIMILGVVGLSSMWMAIFADVGVALIAILNAIRK